MASLDREEIIYVSPAYATAWGESCEVLRANPWRWAEAIHPDDRERVVRAYRKIASGGDTTSNIASSGRMAASAGSRIAFPVRDVSGKIYRVAGLAEDITERKRTQDELNRLRSATAGGRGLALERVTSRSIYALLYGSGSYK